MNSTKRMIAALTLTAVVVTACASPVEDTPPADDTSVALTGVDDALIIGGLLCNAACLTAAAVVLTVGAVAWGAYRVRQILLDRDNPDFDRAYAATYREAKSRAGTTTKKWTIVGAATGPNCTPHDDCRQIDLRNCDQAGTYLRNCGASILRCGSCGSMQTAMRNYAKLCSNNNWNYQVSLTNIATQFRCDNPFSF